MDWAARPHFVSLDGDGGLMDAIAAQIGDVVAAWWLGSVIGDAKGGRRRRWGNKKLRLATEAKQN